MNNIFQVLDVAFSPVDEVVYMMESGGWLIALAALLVIGAAVGILIFNKNKNKNNSCCIIFFL